MKPLCLVCRQPIVLQPYQRQGRYVSPQQWAHILPSGALAIYVGKPAHAAQRFPKSPLKGD